MLNNNKKNHNKILTTFKVFVIAMPEKKLRNLEADTGRDKTQYEFYDDAIMTLICKYSFW